MYCNLRTLLDNSLDDLLFARSAGSDLQTDQVMSAGFLHAVKPLVYDSSLAVRKEAMWSISNITAGSALQIQAILDADLLPAAVTALGNPNERHDVRNECAWAICNALCGATTDQRQLIISMGSNYFTFFTKNAM